MAKVEINVPDLDGKQFSDVWFFEERKTEFEDGSVQILAHINYRKKQTYRPATVEDAIRALRGEEVKCRYKDYPAQSWGHGRLVSMVPPVSNPFHCCPNNGGEISGWKIVEVLV